MAPVILPAFAVPPGPLPNATIPAVVPQGRGGAPPGPLAILNAVFPAVGAQGRGGGRGGRGRAVVRGGPGNQLAANNRDATLAAHAAGDGQVVRHIEGLDPALLRRSRAPDHIDVLDSMQTGIQSSIASLTSVFKDHHSASTSTSIHDKLVNLYKRRKLAADAGRNTAVDRYDSLIDGLEEQEASENNGPIHPA